MKTLPDRRRRGRRRRVRPRLRRPRPGARARDREAGDARARGRLGHRARLRRPAEQRPAHRHPRGGRRPDQRPRRALTVTVSYGDQEQEFALAPTYDAEAGTGTPGEYAALVIPTAPGDYTFHVTGTIEGVKVDLRSTSSPKTFSPVEDASAVAVPGQGAGDRPGGAAARQELPRMATAARGERLREPDLERQDARLRGHRRRRGGHRACRRRAAAPARLSGA